MECMLDAYTTLCPFFFPCLALPLVSSPVFIEGKDNEGRRKKKDDECYYHYHITTEKIWKPQTEQKNNNPEKPKCNNRNGKE